METTDERKAHRSGGGGLDSEGKCTSPCSKTRAIARAYVHTCTSPVPTSPTSAKNRPCKHYYQPCNCTCPIGTLLSQMQR